MAGVLPQGIVQHEHNIRPFVGAQVLESLTSGMYNDALMIYREYVQNSVDAIDTAVAAGQMRTGAGRVCIDISGKNRSVTIEDNGCGVSSRDASRVLTDIGNSAKDGRTERGFRGIGRLGGIGYCDLLRFETRAAPDEQVAVLEWDTAVLRNILTDKLSSLTLERAAQRICTATYRHADEAEPSHFFRVTLLNVRPFYDDALMDARSVRHYLSQVAPVPYDSNRFSLTQKITEHLQAVNGFRAYDIVVNGQRVCRPYADEIPIGDSKAITIDGLDLFEFRTEEGECLARGWYAKTQLPGALPMNAGVRGIRVRQGNIQIGDERLLTDCFGEPRFAAWQIGEVHVTNGHLRPNARRDGFEHCRHYERFLQQAYALGQHLTRMCRRAAEERSVLRRAERLLDALEELIARCALSLSNDSHDSVQERANEIMAELDGLVQANIVPEEVAARLNSGREKLAALRTKGGDKDCLDGRTLRHRTRKELIEEVLRRIRQFHPVSASAEELIGHVLAPYVTPTAARHLEHLSRASKDHG